MSRKTTPRETEKPKKLTRAQKKEIDAVLRKYKGDGKPRTAQATIPYEAIYPDGVCRVDRRTFSKCIAFEDISYQLAQPETRTAIFEHLCDLYNYVDASIHVQLSFLNRKVDPVQYAKSFEIAPQGDDFDDIRAEYTAILQKQLASGNNGIVKTKYLTFTIEADSLKTARARLTRIGLDCWATSRPWAVWHTLWTGRSVWKFCTASSTRTASRSVLTGTGWHPPACLPRILWPRPPSVSVRPKPLVWAASMEP